MYFSNWKIYVTVKAVVNDIVAQYNFSNWKIYVTVKDPRAPLRITPILVTEKFTWL
mgnify:CR=1 FL=1